MKKINFLNFQKKVFVVSVLCLTFALVGCGSKSSNYKGSSTKGVAIVKTAKSQLGKDYRSGGTSPKTGFDCSGLIQWAYKVNGVKVPRVTSQQAKAGKKVRITYAKPGDIVVFRSKQARTGLHTGIYVGDNKFIHSPRTGAQIRIESINSYWKPRLRSVRRIVS